VVETALWGFLGAVIGAAVGAAASIITTWQSNKHEIERQTQADSLERTERARGFQRETLLALQDSLQDWMRLWALVAHEDERAFKETGQWGALLDEELNDGVRESGARLLLLTERVADDPIRAELKRLRVKSGEYVAAKTNANAARGLERNEQCACPRSRNDRRGPTELVLASSRALPSAGRTV
jgi:hypothetical protein